jgi:hypothetical protein
MATHGEIRWPPVGTFDGRLRGDSHGRRHLTRAAPFAEVRITTEQVVRDAVSARSRRPGSPSWRRPVRPVGEGIGEVSSMTGAVAIDLGSLHFPAGDGPGWAVFRREVPAGGNA